MNIPIINSGVLNNSKDPLLTPDSIQVTLQKIRTIAQSGEGGEVVFVFTDTRVVKDELNQLHTVKVVEGTQQQKVSPLIFGHSDFGPKRTYAELVSMFNDIANDMGATHFIINV